MCGGPPVGGGAGVGKYKERSAGEPTRREGSSMAREQRGGEEGGVAGCGAGVGRAGGRSGQGWDGGRGGRENRKEAVGPGGNVCSNYVPKIAM